MTCRYATAERQYRHIKHGPSKQKQLHILTLTQLCDELHAKRRPTTVTTSMFHRLLPEFTFSGTPGANGFPSAIASDRPSMMVEASNLFLQSNRKKRSKKFKKLLT
jgi:hypothetical protein